MSGVRGRSGRRPIPIEMKKQNGTYRPDRAAENAITFPVVELEAPAHVKEDELAYEEWNRIVPMLNQVKVLTGPDLTALASYCLTCSVATRAARQVSKEPLLVLNTVTGTLRPNPAIKIANEARAQCLKFSIEFGLTPAARSRIKGQKPEELEDSAEEFLFHPPTLVPAS